MQILGEVCSAQTVEAYMKNETAIMTISFLLSSLIAFSPNSLLRVQETLDTTLGSFLKLFLNYLNSSHLAV